ncbi:MAG: hypothetical protein ABL999_07495 [Pyrinomonadaceae bacterium]
MSNAHILKDHVRGLDGYKIDGTHFKIGAKIHSTNFYYAKRLFQNSYYTSRIALVLARKINRAQPDKNRSLTIVGYEGYSELLVSLTKSFLATFGFSRINHFVTLEDDNGLRRQPDDVVLNDSIIIIVPIASTGSTAIKVENYVAGLASKDSPANILRPHFNVLVAIDPSENEKGEKVWETVQLTEQSPIIELKNDWREPRDCEFCFDNKKSLPIFETDRSSLTPTLIFDYPKSKTLVASESVPFDQINFEESIIYRTAKRNNEHYLFSSKSDIFIAKNPLIEDWLEKIKNRIGVKATDRVVILSPSHYSNPPFINLVNERVFGSAATIIHHQVNVDYLANFEVLNKRYLERDAKIYFVDDSLISGGTFFSVSNLLRFTAGRSFDAAIFLYNKSSADINERVKQSVGDHLFSFTNINLPLQPRIANKNPLEFEIKRYKDLSNQVLSDVLRARFRKRSEDIDGQKPSKKDLSKAPRHLRMFKATHKVYEFYGSGRSTESYVDFLAACGFTPDNIDDKTAMMKILCQYPFILYLPLRKKTFAWHKEWLNEKLDDLIDRTDQEALNVPPINYEDIRDLKFLVRRAVFLGNYEVLTSRVLGLLARIFDIVEEPKSFVPDLVVATRQPLFKELDDERRVRINQLEELHIFFITQLTEIIHKNGWCAVNLLKNLASERENFKTPRARQFIRMLDIELAIVMHDFDALLRSDNKWRSLYKYADAEKNEKNTTIVRDPANNEMIAALEGNHELLKSNKYEICKQTMGLDLQEDCFLSYLWLKKFLGRDSRINWGEVSLATKTEAIFERLIRLFPDPHVVGTFFVVADGTDQPHVVIDHNYNGDQFIHELDKDKHAAIIDFFKGEPAGSKSEDDTSLIKPDQNIEPPKELKSIIEYVRIDDSRWKDLYALDASKSTKQLICDSKWMLMIRISDDDFNTLGLMGFYADEDLSQNKVAKQLLMLLRRDLGRFIVKHHKNEEFAALREVEATKRFAYLAGHGRQMLQRLSEEESSTFGSVITTMEKLQYLFATKLISPKGYGHEDKKDSEKRLFDSVFLNKSISKEDIEEINKIGNKVFETKVIENRVQIDKDIDCSIEDGFAFSFNNEILKLICFELFINAKKNRFHFMRDEKCSCGIIVNEVALRFDVLPATLNVSLSATGPKINADVLRKIKSGRFEEIKGETEISGLYLMNKVLKFLDPNNNIDIDPDSAPVCLLCGMYRNTAKLTLHVQK